MRRTVLGGVEDGKNGLVTGSALGVRHAEKNGKLAVVPVERLGGGRATGWADGSMRGAAGSAE